MACLILAHHFVGSIGIHEFVQMSKLFYFLYKFIWVRRCLFCINSTLSSCKRYVCKVEFKINSAWYLHMLFLGGILAEE
jgi:hypothetical protein